MDHKLMELVGNCREEIEIPAHNAVVMTTGAPDAMSHRK